MSSSRLRAYLSSHSVLLKLRSKQGCLRSVSSALRAWGKFCDLVGGSHFPVEVGRVVLFAGVCREPGTFTNYVGHLKSSCELLGLSTEWSVDPQISRAKDGLLKAGLAFKGPRLAIGRDVICRLASATSVWSSERFFVIFSWVFMLRAAKEASGLRRAFNPSDVSDLHSPLPDETAGVVGLRGGSLVVRLRSRKSKIHGECIERACVCSGGEGPSIHVPASLCPVHVLWPWVTSFCPPGCLIFDQGVAGRSLAWLRIALEARNIPHASKYGLHALRRGAAQDLVAGGGDLTTLLLAGGWRSSAFKAYLNIVGVEKNVFSATYGSLLDLDEDSD